MGAEVFLAMESDATAPQAPAWPARVRSGWLVGLVAIAALVAGVAHFGDLERFAELARHAEPLWLGAAVVLQCATYCAAALGWTLVLRRAGHPVAFRRLVPVALSKLFADQVIPSAGIGGNVLLIDRLTALGAPRGAAVATLLVSLIGYYSAYAALALAMLLALWVHGAATALMTGLVTTFLLVALAIPARALWLHQRGSRPLPERIERLAIVRTLLGAVGEAPGFLMRDRRLILRVAACNGAIFLADALTLAACLAALGQPFTMSTAFIALMTASIVTTLGPVPMGLGSFEASSTAMLAMLRVPVEAAIAATLLLRTLTLWLPLMPGLVVMRAGLRRPQKVAFPIEPRRVRALVLALPKLGR
jgi:uncharacterized protein (TIRG00374 family)